MSETTKFDPANVGGLISFSLRLNALVACGVSFVNCLRALWDLPSPYGDVARPLFMKISEGYILSKTMREYPEVFPGTYIALVRAGEVGGVLEQAHARLAKLLMLEGSVGRPIITLEGVAWTAMDSLQKDGLRLALCEVMAYMLVGGKSVQRIIEMSALILPQPQRGVWLESAQTSFPADGVEWIPLFAETEKCSNLNVATGLSGAMRRVGIFPDFAVAAVAGGERHGTVDMALHEVARVFEAELERAAFNHAPASLIEA